MVSASEGAREIPVQGGLSPQAVKGLSEFIKKHYLDARLDSLAGRAYRESWSEDGTTVILEWSAAQPLRPGSSAPASVGASTRLSISPGSISIAFPGLGPADEASSRACQRVADDVEVLVDSYLTRAKITSLYFVFSTEERGAVRGGNAPSTSVGREALRRVVSGNMMNLYLLIMAASFGLFFVLGDSAIFAVLAIQLIALFYSDRLSIIVGKVRPTAEMPRVTLVCVPASPETRALIARYAKNLLSDISERLEFGVSRDALEGPDAGKAVQEVLAASGIASAEEEIKVITRDVYGLVKAVSDRFRLPVPKIAIVNNVADNAAATGVSPGRSAITITAGSLEDLEDGELSSVIGHELGHIKGRDSLILFCVTFSLYLGGLYLWLPLLIALGLLYYVLIFVIIFAVGKVLETRADTESAAKLGDPSVLASALTKIGFRQLYYERYSPSVRFFDWLRFDPHPPIYFRIQRLSRFAATGREVGNTLLVSIRDCLTGFLRSFL